MTQFLIGAILGSALTLAILGAGLRLSNWLDRRALAQARDTDDGAD